MARAYCLCCGRPGEEMPPAPQFYLDVLRLMNIGSYFIKIATVFDVALNVVFFNGNPHETISDRAALAKHNGNRWGCILCRVLDWFDKGHCDGAYKVLTTPLVSEFSDL